MARKLSNALAVVLLLVGLVAALPITGLYEKADCTWVSARSTRASAPMTAGRCASR